MLRSFFITVNSLLYWLLTYLFLVLSGLVTWLYTACFLDLTVKGQENIPDNRISLIFTASHQTYIDSWFIITFIKRLFYLLLHPRIIPWNVPEFKNFYRTWLMKFIFKHLRCIPVKRGEMTLREGKLFLQEIKNVLKRYNLLLFFEGSRSRTGKIYQTKKGVGNIIKAAPHSLVIPVRIRGFDQVWPIDTNWFISLFLNPIKMRLKGEKIKTSIIFGQPLDLSNLQDLKPKEKAKQIEKCIKEAVEAL